MAVIGVTPPGFDGLDIGQSPEVRVPMMMKGRLQGGHDDLESRSNWWLQMVGRLKAGVSIEQARSILQPMLLDYMRGNQGGRELSEYEQRVFGSERVELDPAGKGLQTLGDSFPNR